MNRSAISRFSSVINGIVSFFHRFSAGECGCSIPNIGFLAHNSNG